MEDSTHQEVAHIADLDANMPAHLAIMDTMAWFGVPRNDPAGGPDASYGNWDISHFACVPDRSPAVCDASGHRAVASRYHPLAGLYSSTGTDGEGVARIKLMMSNLRSSCDSSARIDAIAVQLDGTHYTTLHGARSQSGPELSLLALEQFLIEADTEHRTNVVLPSNDATWYWNNGGWVGLDCKATRDKCIVYLQQDVIDMLRTAASHPSALRIANKLVLHFYVDSAQGFATADEWSRIFANARAAIGQDFYTIAQHAPPSFFSAFDAIAPWVDVADAWPHTSGTSIYQHARAYAARQHERFFQSRPPGHVVFGNVSPGFDDFTKHWGRCQERQMPRPSEGGPRQLDVIRGSVDYLATKHVKGVMLNTWDDWTEGSFFEPSVEEGTSKLVTLRQKLGDLFGEPQDANGDAALSARWNHYGESHACGGSSVVNPPAQCSRCSAAVVLEPTAGMTVGASIHLRVAGPACLHAMIAYIDGVEVARVTGTTIDRWIAVTPGHHVLHVNSWEPVPQGTLHQSPDVPFVR